jgi:glycosyltransferase involved in cell wall biosynthesis
LLKIVHIDMGRELRGGQRQLLSLALGLRTRGHEQAIVCPEGSALELRASASALPVFELPGHDLGNANGVLQLRQFLLATPTDILHAHDGRSQTISWLASWGLPVRRVASRRVTFLPSARIRSRYVYSRTCHAVIAVSEFVRGLLTQSGVPPYRIKVIPDGVEIPAELPSPETRAQARRQWGVGAHDFVLGQLGAFTREKGQDVAIQALRSLTESLPRAQLLLVGEAPLMVKDDLLRRAGSARDRVHFLGEIENLSPFFAAIDVLVMPSRAEGLGSAALLAMAHGRPVVASRVGGVPEVVEDGVTGWLVPPDSPPELADAVLKAACDPARLAQFGAAACERAHQFSTAIMVARTERLYLSLVGPRVGIDRESPGS